MSSGSKDSLVRKRLHETYSSDGGDRATRRKDTDNPQSSLSLPHGETSLFSVPSSVVNICRHPGSYGGVCVRCGENIDDKSGAALGYVHKSLRLQGDDISQLRDIDLKKLVDQKKLCLVLDLDHTLLNSAATQDITPEELYLLMKPETLPEVSRKSLIKFDWIEMVTKLRPYVRTFLEEANKLFEMYIYTMGDRLYAIQMANLLDPDDVYFSSKIIFREDCTQLHKKGLDLILGKESAVLILDDTEWVWEKHKENLMLIKRYHFFASSCKGFGRKSQSLSERNGDELETSGALTVILRVLQQIHTSFFDPGRPGKLEDRDVREVLKTVRKEILKGCKIVFGSIFPAHFPKERHQLFWKMAEQLGATCSKDLDPSSVTHVVSVDLDTNKARWALKEKKFLVTPKWIEAANYLWKKPREEAFAVTQV